MQKIEKKDVERFFVTPRSGRGIHEISAGAWDQGENCERGGIKDGFYWGQLSKAMALGFPISGGGASHFVKNCTPSRAIAILWFVFTTLELLVKKGLGLPRAILFIQWLYDNCGDQTGESKRAIEERFESLGAPVLQESDRGIFFGPVMWGVNTTLNHVRSQHDLYDEIFERLGWRKGNDAKLAEKCDERAFLHEGWQAQWVDRAIGEISHRLGVSQYFAQGLLYLLCTKAVRAHQERCDHRKTKVCSQMLFAELGCPLNQNSVPRFTDMLANILRELDGRAVYIERAVM